MEYSEAIQNALDLYLVMSKDVQDVLQSKKITDRTIEGALSK